MQDTELGLSQSAYKRVLNLLNDVVFEADGTLNFTFLNAAWTRISMLGVPESLGTSLLSYISEPDAKAALAALLTDGHSTAIPQLTLPLQFAGGQQRWVACALEITRAADGSPLTVHGTLTDVTMQTLAGHALGNRDNILEAVREAAHQFLSPGGWQVHIQQVLARYGVATGATSVRLFRQWHTPDGRVFAQSVGDWWRNAGIQHKQHMLLHEAIDITAFYEKFKHLMFEQGYANWHVDTAPADVYAGQLAALHLNSVLHVPVWCGGQIWGIIELGNANKNVTWTAAERDALRIAADVIAAAITREQDAQVIEQQANILETVAQAATDFLQSLDWQSRLHEFLRKLAEATDVPRAYVYQLVPDHEHFTRIVDQYNRADTAPISTVDSPGFDTARLLPRFIELAQSGQPIALHVQHMSPEEQAVLSRYNIASMLWMPFTVGAAVWGGLALDDFHHHDWDMGEKRALRIAAQILGSTIEHANKLQELATYANELEARNTELDTFSRLIAHDLKAPLSTIINMARLMQDMHGADVPPLVREHLLRIAELGDGLTNMIEQLLWLARLRHARDLSIVETDFALDAALSRYREAINAAQITVRRERLPVTIGQQAWATEVLANLIGNAVKYIGDDNASPMIEITHEPYNETHVRISVKDNGVGISPARQSGIFELFRRVQHGEIYGHGLGLALVQQMVHKMQGEVGLHSQPGVGSTFWFTLPLFRMG